MSATIKKVSKRLVKSAKTDQKRVHITPRVQGWAIRKEGNLRPTKTATTQKEAIKIARDIVSRGGASKVIVHSKNGNFREAK